MADNLFAELLRKATNVGPADGEVTPPPIPPSPPGYGFSLAEKPVHARPVTPIQDPRLVSPTANVDGSYPTSVIQMIVKAAKRVGVPVELALAMGLQESGLGTANRGRTAGNPLSLMLPEDSVDGTSTFEAAATPDEMNQMRSLRSINMSPDASAAAHGELNTGVALRYLQQQMTRHPGNLPHAVQGYNGYGRPQPSELGPKLYGMSIQDLPKDFYGKRVIDLMNQVVKPSNSLKQLVKQEE